MSRAASFGVDIVLQFMVLVAFLSVGGVIASDEAPWVAVVFGVVGVFSALLGYPWLVEYLGRGRTPGMRAAGTRVVTVEGAPVGIRHTAIRAFLGLVDFWLVPVGVVAVFSSLLSSRGQRLGDLAAGTIVVRDAGAGRFTNAVAFPPPPGLEDVVRALDVTRLKPEQYRLVRSFLLRVEEISLGARHDLAQRLSSGLEQSLGVSRPDEVTPELFLVCVVAAHQRRVGLVLPAGPLGSSPQHIDVAAQAPQGADAPWSAPAGGVGPATATGGASADSGSPFAPPG